VFFWQGIQLKKTVTETAVAAKATETSANTFRRIETGYLYLRDPIDGKIGTAMMSSDPLDKLSASITFTNHGRTPVTIRGLNQIYTYLAKLPDIYNIPMLPGVELPHGIVVAVNKDSQSFHCALNFTSAQLRKVRSGNGFIVYIANVEYEDIFSQQRETGVCRVYDGKHSDFYVWGDKQVNYNR